MDTISYKLENCGKRSDPENGLKAMKKLILLLVLVLPFLLVGGCKSHSPSEITLRVATWGDPVATDAYTKELNQLYTNFELMHPGVKIVREVVPDQYVTKMVLDHAAGTPPDVMILDASSAALFIDNGLVQDLGTIIKSDTSFSLSDFYPNTVSIATRGNKIYAIPQDFTPIVVFYDKSKFLAAHIPIPDGTWNFKQFREIAQKLNRPPNSYGFIFNNWMPGWIMWLWNNGGDVIDLNTSRSEGIFNSPRNQATFTYLSDLVNKYHVSPSLSTQSSMGIDLFANGKAAMTVSGHWSLTNYKASTIDPATGKPSLNWENLGVAAMPHNTPESQTVLYESGFAIPEGSPHSQLAWEFIKYMTSYKVQFIYNQSGIAIDARKDVAKARATNPLEKEFLSLVPDGRPPYGSRIDYYSTIEPLGQSALEATLENGVSPKESLTSAAKRIDQEFAKP